MRENKVKRQEAVKPAKGTLTQSTPAQLPELHPGQSVALLQELHILTRDGKLNQDSRRKLKQVDHLLQFIAPLMSQVREAQGAAHLVDHGAGKSYLGFMLYDRFCQNTNDVVCGVETRDELVARSRELATRFGFARMRFVNQSVAESATTTELPERIDIVTALHACDTATDDAIAFGLTKKVSHMILVPCCQAQVANHLRQHKALNLRRTPLAQLWRHPLHTREFGSQITNVLRCLQLEAHGYQVTVTELVGWEHSLKNELIIASQHPAYQLAAAREKAVSQLTTILDVLGLTELSLRYM